VHAFVRLAKTYLRPHWAPMLLAAVLMVLAALSHFLFVAMGKVVVDDVLEIKPASEAPADVELNGEEPPAAGDEQPPLEPGKTRAEKTRLILLFFFVYLAVHALANLFRWISRYKVGLIGQKVVFRLRSDLHTKLQALQMTYFDQVQTGKLMARVIDDVDVIRTRATGTLMHFATSLAMVIIGAVILFSINWRMALVATFCLPLYAGSYQFFAKRIREYTKRTRALNAQTYALLQQRIGGARVVKSFVREKGELLRYHRLGKEFFRTALARSVVQALLSSLAMLISGIGIAFTLWYGAGLVRAGRITPGEILFFYGSVVVLFSPVIALANINVILQWLSVVITRVFEILDEEVAIKDHPDAVRLADVRGLIEFHDVALTYLGKDPRFRGQDDTEDEDAPAKPQISTVALRHVDLRIEPGELVCVMGASGSGKSSLVNLLPRLYEPTRGTVTIDGHDITRITLASLRRHIGLVPQESAIFSGTIADNIRYGAPYAPLDDVIEAAKAAEIHDFIDELPGKYETTVGERGITLSGGQKQRISIARALLTRPRILLLDDCTSALDAKTEARIQETLTRILSDHTAIVITHRASVAMKADKIVVLDDGRVVEQGPPFDLLNRRGYYWRIFTTQQKDMHHVEAV